MPPKTESNPSHRKAKLDAERMMSSLGKKLAKQIEVLFDSGALAYFGELKEGGG